MPPHPWDQPFPVSEGAKGKRVRLVVSDGRADTGGEQERAGVEAKRAGVEAKRAGVEANGVEAKKTDRQPSTKSSCKSSHLPHVSHHLPYVRHLSRAKTKSANNVQFGDREDSSDENRWQGARR